jgi:hypothetical protein
VLAGAGFHRESQQSGASWELRDLEGAGPGRNLLPCGLGWDCLFLEIGGGVREGRGVKCDHLQNHRKISFHHGEAFSSIKSPEKLRREKE